MVDLQCCISFCCPAKWFSYTCVYILFYIIFCYSLSQDIEYSSPCYTVGHCCSCQCVFNSSQHYFNFSLGEIKTTLIHNWNENNRWLSPLEENEFCNDTWDKSEDTQTWDVSKQVSKRHRKCEDLKNGPHQKKKEIKKTLLERKVRDHSFIFNWNHFLEYSGGQGHGIFWSLAHWSCTRKQNSYILLSCFNMAYIPGQTLCRYQASL